MPDLVEEMERAVSLYICGRAEEAAEIAQPLLRRARGTPHAARFYRYMSEFMLASGDYESSREAAREAGLRAARPRTGPEPEGSETGAALRADGPRPTQQTKETMR